MSRPCRLRVSPDGRSCAQRLDPRSELARRAAAARNGGKRRPRCGVLPAGSLFKPHRRCPVQSGGQAFINRQPINIAQVLVTHPHRSTPSAAGRMPCCAYFWNARLLPIRPENRDRGGRPEQNRAFINGILWRLRYSAAWRDVPAKYGSWNTIHQRFRRWRRSMQLQQPSWGL